MNEHLNTYVPQQTLFKTNDPWIIKEMDTKPYILENLDSIKLLRSQHIGTSIINYGFFIDDMFFLEKFT